MSEGLPTVSRVADAYAQRIAEGVIGSDAAQLAVVAKLDALNSRLVEQKLARKSSALGWLFGKKQGRASFVRGLYIYGEVGRGKTMLMDLFFQRAEAPKKRRDHFQAFMADVHKRVFRMRAAIKTGEISGDDPIQPVANELADEIDLLCLDEFTVTDIADAMILGRLFTQLFDRGLVLVTTSNVAPGNLYRDGLNRANFLPFIALLQQRVEVVSLEARTDFRKEKLDRAAVYLTPLGPEADAAMDELWHTLTLTEETRTASLSVLGREVMIPNSAHGVARFEFDDLCSKPLGSSDYLAIANHYPTVMIDHIPVMNASGPNVIKRFILLIDALYDGHVRLVVSAAAEPEALYDSGSGTESFEFQRTASRLIEMRSRDYLRQPHRHFIAET